MAKIEMRPFQIDLSNIVFTPDMTVGQFKVMLKDLIREAILNPQARDAIEELALLPFQVDLTDPEHQGFIGDECH